MTGAPLLLKVTTLDIAKPFIKRRVEGSGQKDVILYAKVEAIFLPEVIVRRRQVFHRELPAIDDL
jgi:hypothetical protein